MTPSHDRTKKLFKAILKESASEAIQSDKDLLIDLAQTVLLNTVTGLSPEDIRDIATDLFHEVQAKSIQIEAGEVRVVEPHVRRGGIRVTAYRRASARSKVTWSAGWMATVAVRLLPVAQRDRYSEEFSNELLELAEAGVSRSRQILHAVRLLGSSPRLYLALRTPQRRATQ